MSAKLEPRGAWKPLRTEAGSPGGGIQTEKEKKEEPGGEGMQAPKCRQTSAMCCVAWSKCLNLSGPQPPGLQTRPPPYPKLKASVNL